MTQRQWPGQDLSLEIGLSLTVAHTKMTPLLTALRSALYMPILGTGDWSTQARINDIASIGDWFVDGCGDNFVAIRSISTKCTVVIDVSIRSHHTVLLRFKRKEGGCIHTYMRVLC